MEQLQFLTEADITALRRDFGTPVYVYDERRLREQAAAALCFPHAFGLTVRFAMKANPNGTLLRLFDELGLNFDASSGYEADRAMRAGIPASKISLSAQELPRNFEELADAGVHFVATSLRQLRVWGETRPQTELAVRFNPGEGSGENNKTNVGGPTASFGIWHEQVDQVAALLKEHQLRLVRIHTHIGSGGDPKVWQRVAVDSLALVERFPQVHTLDLGGGYRVGRMTGEPSTDLQVIGQPVRAAFEEFARRTGRELRLEVEPGGFLVASAGALVCEVTDVVNTGRDGYTFIRANAGMTDFLRPMLYGAQHPIIVVPQRPTGAVADYVVVGHCCESGDLLTPAPQDPNMIMTRQLAEATPGDALVIEGAGAYCAALSAANYNSFPVCPEVLRRTDGELQLIRRRQTLEEVMGLDVQ